ncbi:DBH-like monooxygenase protein 2 [Merluccius polli]|uniref:DBH-like monooxygenase protein 2 n=1 Tax=Merluccius polli TaxID=89951 RepID=A0AA47P4K4_MERPO|nr:DBH-like monooxygenase protein 2 [Merluccius polli]
MKGSSIRMWPQLALLYLLMAWPTGAGAQVADMPFMEYLDPDHLVLLRWGFDDAEGHITFTVSIQTTGWIGFGLSPNGNMIGADMVIGGVGTGGIYFKDRHATGKFLPHVDSHQDYVLISMTEVEGRTSMTFKRPLQTCDEEDFHITAKPIKLIYAYGETDTIEYHSSRRGTKEVNLLNHMPRVTLLDRKYFDITMNKTQIPARDTHYHCRARKMPRLNVTHHVYRIEPLIENMDLVHHMVLYGCPKDVTEDYDGTCYIGNVVDRCFRMTAVWAVGGKAFELPEDAGIPIGGNNNDIHYRLEVHYNNPTSQAGRQDSSGLRFYYTSELRRHNVGILPAGLRVGLIDYKIPPGATQFHTYGTCNTSLFSELVEGPVPDIHLFAVMLHTHLAGRKVKAAVFRDGVQKEFLAVNENYDFEFQEFKNLGNIKTIKPNDDILVECTYNTANREGYTKMGFSTTDEMCLAFLMYYPEITINACWSNPNTSNIEKYEGGTHIQTYPKKILNNPNTLNSLLKYAFCYRVPNVSNPADQENITKYENVLRTLPQIQLVNNVKGTVGNMKDTPTVSCRADPPRTSSSPHSRGTSNSCSVVIGGSALLLLLLGSAV